MVVEYSGTGNMRPRRPGARRAGPKSRLAGAIQILAGRSEILAHALEILAGANEVLAVAANPFAEYFRETGRRLDRDCARNRKYSRVSIKYSPTI